MPQFGSLRRAKRSSEEAEPIIDLSDPQSFDASMADAIDEDAPSIAAEPIDEDRDDSPAIDPDQGDPDQGGPAQGGPAQDDPAQDDPAQIDPAQDDPAAEPSGSADLPRDTGDGMAESESEPVGDPPPESDARSYGPPQGPHHADRGDRVVRVTAVLTLSKGLRRRPTGGFSVLAACVWLLGMVLVGCFTATAAVGLIGGGPIFDPTVFVSTFRIAHLMPVATSDGAVTLVPMLPALVFVALTVRASSWLWDGNRPGQPAPVVPMLSFAGGYVVIAALIATSPTASSQDEPMTQGWGALLGVVLAGVGVTWVRRVLRPGHPRIWTPLRAVSAVLLVLMSMSMLVFIVRMLFSWSEFQGMTDALLDSGAQPASRLDAAVLGSIQLAYLPNILIWVAAYLIGAGFSVGTDTIVSPFTVDIGTLPEVPMVTLLPTSALSMPWLPPLLVALGSLVAGSIIRGAGLAWQMRTRIVVGAAVTLACATALGFLAAASAGGLGPGRLESMGPDVFATWVAAMIVIGLGQLTWALFPSLLADVRPYAAHARYWVGSLRPRRRWIGRPRLPRARRRRRRAKVED